MQFRSPALTYLEFFQRALSNQQIIFNVLKPHLTVKKTSTCDITLKMITRTCAQIFAQLALSPVHYELRGCFSYLVWTKETFSFCMIRISELVISSLKRSVLNLWTDFKRWHVVFVYPSFRFFFAFAKTLHSWFANASLHLDPALFYFPLHFCFIHVLLFSYVSHDLLHSNNWFEFFLASRLAIFLSHLFSWFFHFLPRPFFCTSLCRQFYRQLWSWAKGIDTRRAHRRTQAQRRRRPLYLLSFSRFSALSAIFCFIVSPCQLTVVDALNCEFGCVATQTAGVIRSQQLLLHHRNLSNDAFLSHMLYHMSESYKKDRQTSIFCSFIHIFLTICAFVKGKCLFWSLWIVVLIFKSLTIQTIMFQGTPEVNKSYGWSKLGICTPNKLLCR